MAAPDALRVAGYTPARGPYRVRRRRSGGVRSGELYTWGGWRGDAVAVAMPARLDLARLEADIGRVSRWRFRSRGGDGPRVTAELILLLVPRDEPVQVHAERRGVRPDVRVVRVPAPPKPRRHPPPPFSHSSAYVISAASPETSP